jgi:hypothetical protein
MEEISINRVSDEGEMEVKLTGSSSSCRKKKEEGGERRVDGGLG